MRKLTPNFQERVKPQNWSYPRDKLSTWERRHQSSPYRGLMSRTRRGGPSRDLPAFSRWLKAKLNALASAEGVSLRGLMEDKGSNRANLYRWQKLTDEMDGPQREQVDREFDKLGIPDEEREEPYGYLGWAVASDEGVTMSALEGKIRRSQMILKSKSLSDEERAKFKSLLRGYERAYEGMLDELIEEFERDIDPTRKSSD